MVNKVYQDLEVKNTVTAKKVAAEELSADSATLANAIIQTLTAETLTAQTLTAETMAGTAYEELIDLINEKLSATINTSNISGSWVKLSNGILVQFGTVSFVSEPSGSIFFPTAFHEYIYSLVAVCNNSYSGDTVITLTCSSAAPTSFNYYITRTPEVSTDAPQGFWWIAIGI